MFPKYWICLSVLSLLLGNTPVQADILIFGSDASSNSAASDLVSKNREAQEAIAAFERGDLQECERLLTSVSKNAKDLPAVEIMLARLLMSKGKYSEALSRLETHAMKGIQDPEAHATMGEIAFLSGRYTDAWLQFRESLSLLSDPSSKLIKARKDEITLQLLRFRAQTAERRRDLATAEKLYKELEGAMPKSGFPLIAQARIVISKLEIAKGAELLRKAKKIDGTTIQPELQVALILSGIGHDNAVIEKWFQDGMKQRDTATIVNWSEYLKWLLIQDRAKDVRYFVEKAPAEFRANRILQFLDALALRYLAKIDDAEKAFSLLLSENADDLETADQLALILVESVDQGKKTRAQQLAQSNLRRAQNEESVIATAAWVEFKLGDIDKAEKYLSVVVARGTSNPQTIYYIARLLEARNRKAEADLMYQNAVNAPGIFVQRSEVRKRFAPPKSGDSKSKTDKANSNKPSDASVQGQAANEKPKETPSDNMKEKTKESGGKSSAKEDAKQPSASSPNKSVSPEAAKNNTSNPTKSEPSKEKAK